MSRNANLAPVALYARVSSNRVDVLVESNESGIVMKASGDAIAENGGAKDITIQVLPALTVSQAATVPVHVVGVAANGYTMAPVGLGE